MVPIGGAQVAPRWRPGGAQVALEPLPMPFKNDIRQHQNNILFYNGVYFVDKIIDFEIIKFFDFEIKLKITLQNPDPGSRLIPNPGISSSIPPDPDPGLKSNPGRSLFILRRTIYRQISFIVNQYNNIQLHINEL